MVTTYVNTISTGSLPCMESAVLALAHIENLAAVGKAIAHYDQQMSERVQLPTETLQELLDLHRTCERDAINIFLENSFKYFNQVFLKELRVIFLLSLSGCRFSKAKFNEEIKCWRWQLLLDFKTVTGTY